MTKEEFIGWLDDEWNVVLDHNQPIVRCMDCKHRSLAGDCYKLGHSAFSVDPDDFCAWGERKVVD